MQRGGANRRPNLTLRAMLALTPAPTLFLGARRVRNPRCGITVPAKFHEQLGALDGARPACRFWIAPTATQERWLTKPNATVNRRYRTGRLHTSCMAFRRNPANTHCEISRARNWVRWMVHGRHADPDCTNRYQRVMADQAKCDCEQAIPNGTPLYLLHDPHDWC